MIIQGDCIEELIKLENNSIDIGIFDLPYNQVSCKWDKDKINLPEMWKELLRVIKEHTPLFFFCTTKFGVNLINTAPKKLPFRYDLVWTKSAPVGFLNAKKMPMRKHEMIYVFYKHLPLYDISSHKHKFLKRKETNTKGGLYRLDVKRLDDKKYEPKLPTSVLKYERKNSIYPNRSKKGETAKKYDPPLPVSVIKSESENTDVWGFKSSDKIDYKGRRKESTSYEPPLPTSIKFCKAERGKHSTQKPVNLIKWILKYYSKIGDTCLDITAGSGSTGVACKEMNRKYILIEKEEKFIKIIKERLN